MDGVGAWLRLTSKRLRSPGDAPLRRPGVAAVGAVAALALLGACVTPPASLASRQALLVRYRSDVDAGLDFYESGEFVVAARRFSEAGARASALGELRLESNAVAAACACWLHARQLDELSSCTQRLELLQGRGRRPDPGVNTLIALGAIAGHRPLPPLKLPNAVRPLVRGAAVESVR